MDIADDPIQSLVRDHDTVRKLADKYLNSSDVEVKKQAATQLLQAIHNHSRLEESIFYPNVRCLDDNLVRHFEQDHLKVDDLLATLQGMLARARRCPSLSWAARICSPSSFI